MLQASNTSVFRNDLSGLPLIFRENQQRRVHFSDYSTVTAVFANKENGVFLPFPLFKDDKETCETPFADLFKKKIFHSSCCISCVCALVHISTIPHWSEVYAVVTDSKKIKLGFQKKSKVLSLRCKKVCHKWK